MQRCTRLVFITTLAVLSCETAHAASDLTLDQAISHAINGNPAVLAAAAEAEAATARSHQANGFRLPKVDLMETFSYTDNPAEVFAMTLNQGRFDMDGFFMSDPNTPDALDTWITRVEVTQPIYTGNNIGSRVQQAQLIAEAAALHRDHMLEQVTFDVATAFANATKAAEHRALIQRSRDTTAASVRLAEQYAEQGLIIDADVLSARVHLALMDEMLVEAQSQADMAQAALDFSMGVDQTIRHELSPLPPNPVQDLPLAEWIDNGVSLRHDLNAQRRRIEAGRLEEKNAKSGFLPEVGVVGRYDLYDNTIFGSNGHSGSIMAVAKVNLFRGGQDTARLEAARHDTTSASMKIRQMEEGIRLEVRAAFEALETAKKRTTTATQAVAAAREALRVREHRFKQGLDKMIDLLAAETALHETEVRELAARYDLSLATYHLYFSSGTSLASLFHITSPEE